MRGALDETWALIARRGYADEIRDPAIAARLVAERNKLIQESANPLEKLRLLLEQSPTYRGRDEAIAEAIASPDFSFRDQNGAHTLYFAKTRAPSAVREAMSRRLEAGLELPFDAADLLHQLPAVDNGPIAALVADDTGDDRKARKAAILVGPQTVELLVGNYVQCTLALKTKRNDKELNEKYHRLSDRIAATRINSFIPALISNADQEDPAVISALASLISKHGSNSEDRDAALQIPAPFKDQIVEITRRWVGVAATSPTGKRHHLYPLANAIGRLAYPELLPELKRLLDEDIARLRTAREGFQQAQRRGDGEATSDARTIYGNQYQNAFVRIGGASAVAVIIPYLQNPLFSVEAALALMAIANGQPTAPTPLGRPFPTFGNVATARTARAARTLPVTPSPSETAIFEAVDLWGRPDGDRESQLLAIRLGGIALMMPHTNRDAEIAALIALPQPVSVKRELFMAMAVDGFVLDASLIMQAIDDWLQDAGKNETHAWHKRQHTWEIEPWLELLPFTDRPHSVLEEMQKVKQFYGNGHRQHFDRVVSAVANVPGADGDALLAEFVRTHTDIASDYTWTRAILARDTASAATLCFALVTDGVLGKGPNAADSWHLAQQIAPLVKRYPDLEADLRKRYGRMGNGPGRSLIENLFSETGDGNDVIEMVKSFIVAGQAYNGQLDRALRGATLWHEPVAGSENSFHVRPASVAELRRFLFGLTGEGTQGMALAVRCLVEIDELRDEHGIAAGDPRHPDIHANRPWPLEAAGIDEPLQRDN